MIGARRDPGRLAKLNSEAGAVDDNTMRVPRFWLVLLGASLLVASIGLSMQAARESIRQEQDRRLTARAGAKADLLNGYFEQARTVLALMAEGPEFTQLAKRQVTESPPDYSDGRDGTVSQAEQSLLYLASLYPEGALSEACLIDSAGVELARVVGDQVAPPEDLSEDETKNAFFAATFERDEERVYQGAPYLSPDTNEWVISNSVTIPDEFGLPSLLLHFEVRLSSFQQRLTEVDGLIRVVDADQGTTVLSSERDVTRGPRLADPTVPLYVPIVNDDARAGVHDVGDDRVAFRRVATSVDNANRWIVVASEPAEAASWWSGMSFGSLIALLAGALLLWVLAGLKTSQRRLKVAATTDALTGLPNRELFFDRVQAGLRLAARRGNGAAVLLIDLDRFKEVNDTLGHHRGDELLGMVAAALSLKVRDCDTLARIGGDEFMVFLPEVSGNEGALLAARRLQLALNAPFVVGGVPVQIGGSIGVAMFPHHGQTPELLMQHADVAMYAAKRAHLGVAVYEPASDENTEVRLRIAAELADAIDNSGLVVHYQPKVSLATGEVGGVEALVRWQHADFGLIPPDQFISVAEDTGLIRSLTIEVLRQAMEQSRQWRDDGLELKIAVNMSARCLIDAHCPVRSPSCWVASGWMVRRWCSRSPNRLWCSTRPEQWPSWERSAHSASSCPSMTSVPATRRWPVCRVFRSMRSRSRFVMSMTSEEKDAFIVRSTVALGQNLGLRVVAEGVEDDATLHELRSLGCDAAQGFLMSRPLPAEELLAWITANERSRTMTTVA